MYGFLYVVIIIYRKERNILEVVVVGVSFFIKLVVNIVVNLIVFFVMLEFVNVVFFWFGSFVGYFEFFF